MTKYQNIANSKWRTAAILNRLLAISQRIIVRLTRNLIRRSRILRSDTGHMTKIPKFENLRWRTTAISKIVSSLYLSCGYHPITMKFGVPLHKWRTAAILNRLLAISQRIIFRLTRNLIRRSRIAFRHRSHDQNTKI